MTVICVPVYQWNICEHQFFVFTGVNQEPLPARCAQGGYLYNAFDARFTFLCDYTPDILGCAQIENELNKQDCRSHEFKLYVLTIVHTIML